MVYPLLSQHVRYIYNIRLYLCTMHVWCVSVFPSLSYTNMHIPYCFCCGGYKCVLSTNKLWELNLLQGMHSMAQLSFVRKSLFISELHEHAYSHCSLLWCKMGVFLPTIYQIVGVVSLFHTCLQSLTHPSI